MSDPIFEELENDPDLELANKVHNHVTVLTDAYYDLSDCAQYMVENQKRISFNVYAVNLMADAFAHGSDLVTELYEENHVLRDKLGELTKELETLRRKS